MWSPRGLRAVPREPGDHRRRTAPAGGRKAGARDPTTSRLMTAAISSGVPQAVADSLPSPFRPPHRRGGASLNVPSSGANRPASDRASALQCHAATHRRVADRECKSSLPVGAHGDRARPAAARPGRSHVGTIRRRGFDRYSLGRDGDRDRTACPARARVRQGSRAAIPAHHVFGSEAPRRPAQRCGRHDHPSETAGTANRLPFAPMARVA